MGEAKRKLAEKIFRRMFETPEQTAERLYWEKKLLTMEGEEKKKKQIEKWVTEACRKDLSKAHRDS